MTYIIVCKNGRRIVVPEVIRDLVKDGILRLDRETNGALLFNFENILFYGKKDDVNACYFSETRI